jgi:hypothetical protein
LPALAFEGSEMARGATIKATPMAMIGHRAQWSFFFCVIAVLLSARAGLGVLETRVMDTSSPGCRARSFGGQGAPCPTSEDHDPLVRDFTMGPAYPRG